MKYRKSVRKMKRDLRKRHTKEGGSRRKRKRQTRKKQRKVMVGGNRTVKDDEWRIHRKYSRVNYKDGGDFDFDKYDNEYKGDRIIHVWRRQKGGSYEHSLQVLGVEEIEKEKEKEKEIEKWYTNIEIDEYTNQEKKPPISKLHARLSSMLFKKKYKLRDGLYFLDDIANGKKLNYEGPKMHLRARDVILSETERTDKFLYNCTLFIYYMNAITNGDLMEKEWYKNLNVSLTRTKSLEVEKNNIKENIYNWFNVLKKYKENKKNKAEKKKMKFIKDKDYEWLSHWVLNCGLFNGASDAASGPVTPASVTSDGDGASKKIPVDVSATLKIPGDKSNTAKIVDALGVVDAALKTGSALVGV
tara:strand:+ start:7793 stop:8866 length:1074 start_codon:yes stop_codon:yes gene_type:complete